MKTRIYVAQAVKGLTHVIVDFWLPVNAKEDLFDISPLTDCSATSNQAATHQTTGAAIFRAPIEQTDARR